jgi:hypothetical protein
VPKDRLYIIGNGFDLHHGIKSRYWDFRVYLYKKNPDLVEKLEEYFGNDALWSNFEETLAYLDTEQIVDECSDFLVPYSAEDWSDAYHHDYQYELQKQIDFITEDLKREFTDWILQLTIPENAVDRKIPIDVSSRFINFNYTPFLQRLYRVPRENILYIHNEAIDRNSTLILGHSRIPNSKDHLDMLREDIETDPRVAEGNRILDHYFVVTYKATEKIISDCKSYFQDLHNLKEIYILGHSLSVVDKPYFEEILVHIQKGTVKWNVSFYDKKELFHHKEFFQELGIDSVLVNFDRLSRIDTPQLPLFPS